MASYKFIRYALGIIYLHFGLLKFFPDLSSAQLLAEQTILKISSHTISVDHALNLLAIFEVTIGTFFLLNVLPRLNFFLFQIHMLGTFLPFLIIPEMVFKIFPFVPNMHGKYIIKNIFIIVVAWEVIYPNIKLNKEG